MLDLSEFDISIPFANYDVITDLFHERVRPYLEGDKSYSGTLAREHLIDDALLIPDRRILWVSRYNLFYVHRTFLFAHRALVEDLESYDSVWRPIIIESYNRPDQNFLDLVFLSQISEAVDKNLEFNNDPNSWRAQFILESREKVSSINKLLSIIYSSQILHGEFGRFNQALEVSKELNLNDRFVVQIVRHIAASVIKSFVAVESSSDNREICKSRYPLYRRSDYIIESGIDMDGKELLEIAQLLETSIKVLQSKVPSFKILHLISEKIARDINPYLFSDNFFNKTSDLRLRYRLLQFLRRIGLDYNDRTKYFWNKMPNFFKITGIGSVMSFDENRQVYLDNILKEKNFAEIANRDIKARLN